MTRYMDELTIRQNPRALYIMAQVLQSISSSYGKLGYTRFMGK